MLKRMTLMVVPILLLLAAQGDFLRDIEVRDLKLDRIETPSTQDTAGISNLAKFLFGNSKIALHPNETLVAEALTTGRDGIWITVISTGKEIQIDDRGFMPKWSPDGSLIAFLKQKVLVGKYHKGHQLYGEDELWLCGPEGGNKIKLISNTHVGEFVWSPNGDFICFEGVDSTGNIDEPYYVGVVDITTGEIKKIDTGTPYNDILFSISPDSRMIAYCKPLKWELRTEWWITDAEIFIADKDGKEKTQITDTEEVETLVKWSEDGKSLIVEQRGQDPCDVKSLRYVKIIIGKK